MIDAILQHQAAGKDASTVNALTFADLEAVAHVLGLQAPTPGGWRAETQDAVYDAIFQHQFSVGGLGPKSTRSESWEAPRAEMDRDSQQALAHVATTAPAREELDARSTLGAMADQGLVQVAHTLDLPLPSEEGLGSTPKAVIVDAIVCHQAALEDGGSRNTQA